MTAVAAIRAHEAARLRAAVMAATRAAAKDDPRMLHLEPTPHP
jgi:hypothetical protein